MSGDMMSLEAARGFTFVSFFQIDHWSLSDLNRFNLSILQFWSRLSIYYARLERCYPLAAGVRRGSQFRCNRPPGCSPRREFEVPCHCIVLMLLPAHCFDVHHVHPMLRRFLCLQTSILLYLHIATPPAFSSRLILWFCFLQSLATDISTPPAVMSSPRVSHAKELECLPAMSWLSAQSAKWDYGF